MTIDQLRSFGCNVEEGLHRCMDNEMFYLRLVDKFLSSTALAKLHDALEKGDLEVAFQETHALKGVAGNLSLTPLYDVLVEMVEPLRKKTEMDYLPLYGKLDGLLRKMKGM